MSQLLLFFVLDVSLYNSETSNKSYHVEVITKKIFIEKI